MELGDQHVAWLHAQVRGDEPGMRQIMARFNGPGDLGPLAPLIYHAFVIAVRRAFGPQFTPGEVIRLVANVRTVLSELPDAVDPVAAESEIRRALGDPVPFFPDSDARAAAQMTVLDYLVHDLDLDEKQLDILLGQARQAVTSSRPG